MTKSPSERRYCAEAEIPKLCGVCQMRPAGYVNYRPRVGMPFLWFCDDINCFHARKAVYAMIEQDYEAARNEAIWEGGKAGGAYLDQIGKADIGALSKEEYFKFLGTVHHCTDVALRERIKEWAAVTGAGENG